ncbi:MAG: ABC transporter substrate-binding protein [Clostridiales bacterium]|nr:ABC transporter substrate-binding protein [Clostridiales bacterium]
MKKVKFASLKGVKLASLAMACLVAATAVAGCSGGSDKIKIGLVAPLTGDSGVMGESQRRGYEMAMGEINAAGGVNGKTLELLTYDDQGDPQKAASGAQKFADDKSVLAIGGSCNSSSTLAMIPIIDAGKLPDLVVSSSSAALTGASEYFFRMSVQDAAVGPLMADALLGMGKKNVVVLYPNNDYGKGLNESISARMTEQGGQILSSLTYQATDQDFTAQLTTVRNLFPDAIALAGTPTDSGLLIKQIRQMGIQVPLIGGTGLYNAKTIEICGDASEDLIVIGVYVASNPDPKVRELVDKYVAKYNQEPDGFAALAYDQMYVIAEAAKSAMSEGGGAVTRETLAAALKKTAYDGVTGDVSFNEVNDWVRPYLTLTVKDGSFVMFEG